MTLPTPYYEQDGIVIYHGDCRELLPDLSADVIITDPPYGVNKAVWDDEFPLWWADLVRPNVIGLMPGNSNIGRCPDELAGLPYRWTLAVHVTNGMTRGAVGYGNWIPCLLYAKPSVSVYRQASDVGRVSLGRSGKVDHPSPKPIEAMRWIVSMLPSGDVLDPFMGSGSTLVAAYEHGRKAIGIEIEERYCEIAAKRLQQSVLPLEIPA
jgi:site-specific DNA-methyltransferase (adenine-specific)